MSFDEIQAFIAAQHDNEFLIGGGFLMAFGLALAAVERLFSPIERADVAAE